MNTAWVERGGRDGEGSTEGIEKGALLAGRDIQRKYEDLFCRVRVPEVLHIAAQIFLHKATARIDDLSVYPGSAQFSRLRWSGAGPTDEPRRGRVE